MSATLQVLAAGVGTYLMRVSSIALLGENRKLPERAERILRLVAPAVLASLVANSLLIDDGELRPFGNWHVAIAIAVVVALWKKSAGWTLAAGMVAVWVLNALF